MGTAHYTYIPQKAITSEITDIILNTVINKTFLIQEYGIHFLPNTLFITSWSFSKQINEGITISMYMYIDTRMVPNNRLAIWSCKDCSIKVLNRNISPVVNKTIFNTRDQRSITGWNFDLYTLIILLSLLLTILHVCYEMIGFLLHLPLKI